MAQQRIGVREMRLVFETEPGNYNRTSDHIMDEIAKILGKVNNVHVAFAFFDVNTGRRLRTYGPFGVATSEMKKVTDVELADAEEVPA